MARFELNPTDSIILVVDPQLTFMPGGELAVPEGDQIVEPGCRFLARLQPVQAVVTQDWHPKGHVSFASSHPGRKPFEVIELYGQPQVLWPDHAVQGSPTARIHPGLPLDRFVLILRKGFHRERDSYSAFRENYGPDGRRVPTGLAGYLREKGIRRLAVWGLAFDYCVGWSALDARAEGFDVCIVTDLTRAVDPKQFDACASQYREAGVELVTADEVVLA